jgi:hypothetical protein
MKTLHINTIKQKVADYLIEDNHSESWIIGNNVIFWHCRMHFRLGNTIADINTILDMCYRSDIEMFAIDNDIIDVEEVA